MQPMVARSVDLKQLTGYGAEKFIYLTDKGRRQKVLKRYNDGRPKQRSLTKEGLIMESHKDLVELMRENLDAIASQGLEGEFYGRTIDKERSINLDSGLFLTEKPAYRAARNRIITRSVDLKSFAPVGDRPERGGEADPHYKKVTIRHTRNVAASISKVQTKVQL